MGQIWESAKQSTKAEKKKRTRPPPKENLLGNFSGLKENFPGRWRIQKPYENQENHTTTEIFPRWPPFFGAKRSPAAKASVRAPGLSTNECEHPFV